MVGVTWMQARDFAVWVGRHLPSEAEWERAARAGDQRWKFPWGNSRRPEHVSALAATEVPLQTAVESVDAKAAEVMETVLEQL